MATVEQDACMGEASFTVAQAGTYQSSSGVVAEASQGCIDAVGIQMHVVIDQEHVTGLREEPVAAVAIYEIEDDIIRRVWFVRDR